MLNGAGRFQPCSRTVRHHLARSPVQWICMVILACMAVFYRGLFFAALKWKEWKTM